MRIPTNITAPYIYEAFRKRKLKCLICGRFVYVIWGSVCVKFIFASAIMYLGKEMPIARQTVRSNHGISDNACIIYHIVFSYS